MKKSALARKRHGIHYTPIALANFLAEQIWDVAQSAPAIEKLRILDPACGDGQLLCAMARAIDCESQLELVGFETDQVAAEQAKESVSGMGRVEIHCEDFIDFALTSSLLLMITKG